MTLLSQHREVGEFKKRYKWMALTAVIAFAVLTGRAVQLQLIEQAEWARIARDNVTKTVSLPATRGLLYDVHGRIVATNRPAYALYVTPQYFDLDADLPRLATLMGLDAHQTAELRQKIVNVPARRRTHQIEVEREISRDQLAALETHASEFRTPPPSSVGYVDVVAQPVRTYPFHALAAHAIGFLNEVSAEDLDRHASEDYRSGDAIGRSGLERAWESYLRGRRGYRRRVAGLPGREGSSHEERREPVPGRDLTVTLDMELMQIVERAFRGQPSGGAVVVDVRTGRVRALYSKPSYDLDEMANGLSSERNAEISQNPLRPLIDKTIYESYFPGSTFKVITALASLEQGIADTTTHFDCPGYYEFGGRRFRCTHTHGDVDMRRAIVQSCNTFFWDLARQVGLDNLARYAHDFGIGDRTGIGINTETAGFIPTVTWYQQHYANGFRGGFTLNEAIGQGNTKVTLIQLAMAYAAVANGGTLYVPQLVERVASPDGSVIEEFTPRVRRRLHVSREHLTYVVDGLYGVVNDPSGTAYDAHVPGGVPAAGKTGTAQVSGHTAREDEDPRQTWYFNRSHAWFAGFAPAGDPEVVVVVLVEHGGGGGKNAAPIGLQILQEYLGGRGSTQQLLAAQAARARALEDAPRRAGGEQPAAPLAPHATDPAEETD